MHPENWIRTLRLRARALFQRRRVEEELDEELTYHVEQRTAENISKGMTPEEAQRAAALWLRGVERTKVEIRDVMPLRWLDHFWRDVRFGLRMLIKYPGFTAIAVTALALGIGADTTMYTIVNGALSWDMGLDNHDRIVAITTIDARRGQDWGVSYPDFRDFRTEQKSLAGTAAYDMEPVNVSDRGALPERYYGVQMSANGFSVVQQKPLFGRDFVDADERPGAPAVVMLGYHVWRDRYGSDPAIVGKSITIDAIPRVVIGVMPPGRRFPEETDLWTPLVPDGQRERRDSRNLTMFGRLRDGAGIAPAQAEMSALAKNLADQYPDTNRDVTAQVMPIMQLTGLYFMRPLILVLFGAVGFVLLISCADVANMLLARAGSRTREFSIRVAIGAGKISIIRQLMVESVVLSIAGGFFGWLVALGGLRWFDVGLPKTTRPPWMHLTLDRTAMFYLAAISIGTGILFGLAPALRLAKSDVNASLKEGGGHGVAGGKFTMRLSNSLVAFQMALCVVLLAGAGLMVRSAMNLYSAPIGVNTAGVLTMRVNLPEANYAKRESWIAFHKDLEKRLSALPGVEMAGVASNLPMAGWSPFAFEFEGRPNDASQPPQAGGLVVSNNYFDLMQVRPLQGRVFTDVDGDSGPPAAVVNERFAAEFWPGESPLGKRFRLLDEDTSSTWMTVVGVVPDIMQNFREYLKHDPLVYIPFGEKPDRQIFVVARTLVPPGTLSDAFRREVQSIDANLPAYDMRTLQDHIDEARLSATLFSAICSVFAAIATLLAAVGLYGVMAHAVSRRTQEIGLRMAIGASRRDIAKLVVGQCIGPLAAGLSIGLLLALAATRLLETQLEGVSSHDPLTYVATVLVLCLAALLGCVIPARRAMRVDPMVALRYE
jgi:putative ABC transport system permease protein